MATILAVCPYCRAGGVRAPSNALGASATCPKCGSSFTVMPSEGLPGWAKEPKAAAPTQPVPVQPIAETKPTASLSDVTEPSPILPREDRPKPKSAKGTSKPKAKAKAEAAPEAAVAPVPQPVAQDDSDDSDEDTDFGMVVALAALSLVGVAVLATLFPYGRFIAAGFAVIGLLGGLASLGAEGKPRQLGAAAIALHVLLLLVVFFAPSVLNLDPWRRPIDPGPQGPQTIAHGSGERSLVTPDIWVDGTGYSWEFKDVRVTVRSATVGQVELLGPKEMKRNSREQYLQLTLRLSNAGVERQIDLNGWATGQALDTVRVTDAAGRPLKLANFEGVWQPELRKPTEHLFPGKTADVRMILVLPSPKLDSVRVQLPGTAFGMPEETIKFQVATGLFARN